LDRTQKGGKESSTERGPLKQTLHNGYVEGGGTKGEEKNGGSLYTDAGYKIERKERKLQERRGGILIKLAAVQNEEKKKHFKKGNNKQTVS